MHFQVIQTEEELFAVLTLIGAFASVFRRGVLHNVLFAQHGNAANFAVEFPDRQRKMGVVEHCAMKSVVKWMRKSHIATATTCN